MLRWNGDSYIAEIERTVGDRVRSVGFDLMSDVRANISTPSRTVTEGTTRTGKKKKILGARGSNRSKPGEFVHKDFGTLRQSIAHEYDPARITTRVGSANKVARFIELGTSRMAPRKMLRATLAQNRQKYADKILAGAR